VYDSTAGLTLQFSGADDLFVFINGILALDLGAFTRSCRARSWSTVIQVQAKRSSPKAACLDATGNITTTQAGYVAAGFRPLVRRLPSRRMTTAAGSPTSTWRMAKSMRLPSSVQTEGPIDSNFQLTLTGSTIRRSVCQPYTLTLPPPQ